MTKAALGGRAIQRAATCVKPEQASKVMMRMPTRRNSGKAARMGKQSTRAADSIRRGNGRGTLEG